MSIKNDVYVADEKPFDITQHEWSDERLSHDGDTLNVEYEFCSGQLDSYEVDFLNLELRKKDAIAIAKHFKLTAEDLK